MLSYIDINMLCNKTPNPEQVIHAVVNNTNASNDTNTTHSNDNSHSNTDATPTVIILTMWPGHVPWPMCF